MTTSTGFDLLRAWAARMATQYAGDGHVTVVEPTHPNAALTVNLDLSEAMGQLLLWPNGMSELRVVAVTSGEDVAIESRKVEDDAAVTGLFSYAERLIRETQTG